LIIFLLLSFEEAAAGTVGRRLRKESRSAGEIAGGRMAVVSRLGIIPEAHMFTVDAEG
jgi:hypothetical protein